MERKDGKTNKSKFVIVGLFHPILPRTSGGRLKFALCAKCADEENQEECQCSDQERALSGTWTTGKF